MEHTIEFWLPFPPSTNRLWRSVRGRVILDKKYKNWKHLAAKAIVTQDFRNYPVFGPHQIEVKLSTTVRHRGDADNRLKAILDLAKELRFIMDDNDCTRASVEWATIDHDCLVKLTGEIAYADQWEFATALTNKQAARNRSRIVRSARDFR